MSLYDPVKLADEIKQKVVRGNSRKYYRIARPGRWYGGISTADCVGCCLKCVYCWSGKPREHPELCGEFYSPDEVFRRLTACARKFGYRQLRISGNEPTIGMEHLLKVLELTEQSGFRFILETNGILIGHNPSYAAQLSKFNCVHVRVSIKAAGREEFSRLTGAYSEAFDLQLEALRRLVDVGVSCHPAVMLSFSQKEAVSALKNLIGKVDRRLEMEFEEEYVFLYPHVAMRLKKAGLKPLVAYTPEGIPEELI